MAFKWGKTTDLANNKGIFWKTEFSPDIQIVAGPDERFNSETAQYAGVHFWPADSRSKVTPSHCVSRTKEMSRGSGSDFLRGKKHGVCDWALERAKRRAMNVMNDNWYTRAFCGKPT